ncbi:MAG TPA: ROK family protein [Sporichthyaceae bacterium]|nr:ROK family protein [Sporichthyaceae bacterium]
MPTEPVGPRAALAVDVGGTKLAAGVVDETGRVWHSARVPTPPGGDGDTVWQALVGLIADVRGAASAAGAPEPAGIGVGCGGPMRWPAGAVSPLNIGGWREFPLRDRLAGLADGPVRVHNDAIALAVAEHWRGAGVGHRDVLGMVVSTGVGGGLVLGDRVVDGTSGNAGHIGHVVVDPAGPQCACGGFGCLEAVAAGPRTVAWALANGWAAPVADGRSLVAAARAGHPVAVAALARAGTAVGVGIASATALCDVAVVVVGGGLTGAGELLFGPLRQALARHARLGFTRDVSVVPAALGADAGLVGAAALVLAGDRYWSAD